MLRFMSSLNGAFDILLLLAIFGAVGFVAYYIRKTFYPAPWEGPCRVTLARACLKAWSWDQGRATVPESSVSLGDDSLDPDPSLPRPFNMSNEMMR